MLFDTLASVSCTRVFTRHVHVRFGILIQDYCFLTVVKAAVTDCVFYGPRLSFMSSRVLSLARLVSSTLELPRYIPVYLIYLRVNIVPAV